MSLVLRVVIDTCVFTTVSILNSFEILNRYVIIPVALGIYAWFDEAADSAAIKIVIFHLQSLLLLLMGGIEWQGICFNNTVCFLIYFC